jgi:hypothetical protein
MFHLKLNKWQKVLSACVAWLAAWVFTQGLFMGDSLLRVFSGGFDVQILKATLWVGLVLGFSLVVFKNYDRRFLTRSRLIYLYFLPAALIAILPWHYHLTLSIPLFVLMVIISTFWQDYLTFGIFQTFIQSKLVTWMSVIIVGVLFTIGHFIFFIDSFSLASMTGWLALLSAGLLFSWQRKHFGNIYVINVLHLSFLLLFV